MLNLTFVPILALQHASCSLIVLVAPTMLAAHGAKAAGNVCKTTTHHLHRAALPTLEWHLAHALFLMLLAQNAKATQLDVDGAALTNL